MYYYKCPISALINRIYNLCQKRNKKLIIYLSMAFGNPYSENYNLADN